MNRTCCRTSSDKNGALLVADKKCCPSNRTTADSSPSMRCGKTRGHVKIKRLRSHRQRNQLRGCAKKASKSNHHRCQHPRSTDIAHLHMCCHSSCPCPSRRAAPLPNVVHAKHEPSIITENRLTGHQGLFNREVKSVDIDRLLSRQREVEKNEQEIPKKSVSSHPPSVSPMPSPFCTNQCSEADDPLPCAKKNYAAKKSPDISVEEEGKSLHKSDTHVTPAQRQRQQWDPPTRSCKGTASSKRSSLNVVVFKSRRTRSDITKKARECSRQGTPDNLESPISNTQVHHFSPKPVMPPSPQTPEAFDLRQRRQEPDCVSQSIKRVAAGLCAGLRFPYLRQRDLVAESREVLLKALEKSHGPRLQENLLQVRQLFGFCSGPTDKVQDQEMCTTDTDEFLLAGRNL